MNSNKPKLPGKTITQTLLIIGFACLLIAAICMGMRMFFPLCVTTLILFFVLVFGAMIFANKYAPKLNGKTLANYMANLPEIKVPAKVIAKNMGTGSQASFNHAGFVVVPVFDITFELVDKQRLFFRINDELFYTIIENEEGMLTYKEGGGKRYFISFQPN